MPELTEEQQLFLNLRSARRNRDVQGTGQHLGALAEVLRTGGSAKAALDARAPDHGIMTEKERIALSTPIIGEYEKASRAREFKTRDIEQLERERRANYSAKVARIESDDRIARGVERGKYTGQTLTAAGQAAGVYQDLRVTIANGSKQTQANVAGALAVQPGSNLGVAVKNAALEGAQMLAKEAALNEGTQEYNRFVERKVRENTKELVEGLQRGEDISTPDGKVYQGTADKYRDGAIASVRGLIEDTSAGDHGEANAARMIAQSALGMSGEAIDQLLGPAATQIADRSKQTGEGELARTYKNQVATGATAEEALKGYGAGNARAQAVAKDLIADLHRPLEGYGTQEGAAAAVNAGVEGAGYAEGGAEMPPEGVGAAPAGVGGMPARAPRQFDPNDEAHVMAKQMGAEEPPGDTPMERMVFLLDRIERMPRLPPVQQAKQAMLQSKGYLDYKDKHGLTADEIALPAFTKFVRKGYKKTLQDTRQKVQAIGSDAPKAAGPVSKLADSTEPPKTASRKTRADKTKARMVQGADTGTGEDINP